MFTLLEIQFRQQEINQKKSEECRKITGKIRKNKLTPIKILINLAAIF